MNVIILKRSPNFVIGFHPIREIIIGVTIIVLMLTKFEVKGRYEYDI